jgi:hypothetical protein
MEAVIRGLREAAKTEATSYEVQQLHQKNDRLKLLAADLSPENLTLKSSRY